MQTTRQTPPPWWARTTQRPLMSPRQVRRRTVRGTLGTILVTLVVILGLALTLAGGQHPATRPTGQPGGLEHRQTTQALIAGCGGIYTFTGTLAESGTTPGPYTWRTIVPMFGPMSPDPAPTSQHYWPTGDPGAPTPEHLLRNQWNGALIAYYTPNANPGDVANLRHLADSQPDLRMLVTPWPADRGPLPRNRNIAYATWNASQTCARLNAAALQEFRTGHPASDAPGYTGTQPSALTD